MSLLHSVSDVTIRHWVMRSRRFDLSRCHYVVSKCRDSFTQWLRGTQSALSRHFIPFKGYCTWGHKYSVARVGFLTVFFTNMTRGKPLSSETARYTCSIAIPPLFSSTKSVAWTECVNLLVSKNFQEPISHTSLHHCYQLSSFCAWLSTELPPDLCSLGLICLSHTLAVEPVLKSMKLGPYVWWNCVPPHTPRPLQNAFSARLTSTFFFNWMLRIGLQRCKLAQTACRSDAWSEVRHW